jgi:hypothetical protein
MTSKVPVASTYASRAIFLLSHSLTLASGFHLANSLFGRAFSVRAVLKRLSAPFFLRHAAMNLASPVNEPIPEALSARHPVFTRRCSGRSRLGHDFGSLFTFSKM